MRLKNGRVTGKGSDEEGGRLFWERSLGTCNLLSSGPGSVDEKGKALVLCGPGEMQAGRSRFYSMTAVLYQEWET